MRRDQRPSGSEPVQLHCVWLRRVEFEPLPAFAPLEFAFAMVGRRASVHVDGPAVAATRSARGLVSVTLPLRSNRRNQPVCGDCARSRWPLLLSVGRYSQPLSVVPYNKIRIIAETLD